jgi:hypothetical protein
MAKKRRMKKGPAGHRPAAAPVGTRSAAVTSSTIVWESAVFAAGGYESASRFLLQGLLAAGADVDLRPLWGKSLSQIDGD